MAKASMSSPEVSAAQFESPYLLDTVGELDPEGALDRACAHDCGWSEERSQHGRLGCDRASRPYLVRGGGQRKEKGVRMQEGEDKVKRRLRVRYRKQRPRRVRHR